MHAIRCELSIRRIYSLVVFYHSLTIAMRGTLARSIIEAMRITVVTPGGFRPKLLSHLQGFLHEYPAILLETMLRFLLNGRVTPNRMLFTFQFYGQSLVRFEGGPVLSEDRSPALKVYHADAAEWLVRNLLDQVFLEYLEMFLQVAFLRNATVSFSYNSWKYENWLEWQHKISEKLKR